MSGAGAIEAQLEARLSAQSPQFREIVELIGIGPALALVVARRGRRVYIPAVNSLHPEHWLTKLLGLDEAGALADCYGPGQLEVPTLAGATYARMLGETWRLTEAGQSANQIARALGITRRTVHNHRQALRRWRNTDPPRLD